jgi:periplasmic protein TonB
VQSAITQESVGSILPVWLRLLALVAVVLAHGAFILALAWPTEPETEVPVHLQIDVVAQGEPARSLSDVDSRSVPEVRPSEPQVRETSPSTMKGDDTEPTEVKTRDAAEVLPRAIDSSEVNVTKPTEVQAATIHPPDDRQSGLPQALAQVTAPQDARAAAPDPSVETNTQPSETAEIRQLDMTEASPAEQLPEVDVAALSAPAERAAVPEQANPQPVQASTDQTAVRRDKPVPIHRKPVQIRKPAREAALESEATTSRAGSASGHATMGANVGAMATATYRALVIAELNRHKQYPDSARSAGIQGTAVVAFTIGPSGRVLRHSITRSSGNATLDNAVHQMMTELSLPPPPAGTFRATAPIQFTLRR